MLLSRKSHLERTCHVSVKINPELPTLKHILKKINRSLKTLKIKKTLRQASKNANFLKRQNR